MSGDSGITVQSSLDVDPSVVDLNLYSEAMMRVVAAFNQLMAIYHAPDASDKDREYASKMLDILISRTEYEFRPLYKRQINATKH